MNRRGKESLRGPRVAVTGAAGFIGSALARELASHGTEVVAIDCLLEESRPAGDGRAAWGEITRLDGVEGRLVDLRSDPLEPVLEGVAVVFHLSAMTGLHPEVPGAVYRACNVEASRRLAAACVKSGIERLIHASTSSVYGATATGAEDSALEPVSDYGRTKLEAEGLLLEAAANEGLDLTILRLFSVYGPGQRSDMAYYRIIEAALTGGSFTVFGDGEQSRSNTYVDDVVDALIRGTAPAAAGETLNVAGGEAVTLNRAIETVERLTGRQVRTESGPARPDDQRATEGDWSKARELIGFEPRTSFEEGIARQVEWQARSFGP